MSCVFSFGGPVCLPLQAGFYSHALPFPRPCLAGRLPHTFESGEDSSVAHALRFSSNTREDELTTPCHFVKFFDDSHRLSAERNDVSVSHLHACCRSAAFLLRKIEFARSLELARIIVAYWDPFTQFQLILPCFLPASFVVQQWKYCVVPFWNIG